MSEYTLSCVCVDEMKRPMGGLFIIRVNVNWFIAKLQLVVKDARLKHAPANELDNGHLEISPPLSIDQPQQEYSKNLANIISYIYANGYGATGPETGAIEEGIPVTYLHPVGRISEYFKDEPPIKCLHIIVCVSPAWAKESMAVDSGIVQRIMYEYWGHKLPDTQTKLPDFLQMSVEMNARDLEGLQSGEGTQPREALTCAARCSVQKYASRAETVRNGPLVSKPNWRPLQH